jgi:hypothetical protein
MCAVWKHIHGSRGDGGLQEAGAVGRPDRGGKETIASTSNGTVAVVAGAGTLLHSNVGKSHGDEGQDSSKLHFDDRVGDD